MTTYLALHRQYAVAHTQLTTPELIIKTAGMTYLAMLDVPELVAGFRSAGWMLVGVCPFVPSGLPTRINILVLQSISVSGHGNCLMAINRIDKVLTTDSKFVPL